MYRTAMGIIGLLLLAGCSGGGEETGPTQAAQSPGPTKPTTDRPPPPPAQPDMLTATPQGLMRGKANGQEQRVIFTKPNMHLDDALVHEGQVLYQPGGDIWTVGVDGTGNRALLNTPDDEVVKGVTGPWLIYAKEVGPTLQHWSLNTNTGQQVFLDDFQGTDYRILNNSRVLGTSSEQQISSHTVTGADRITYARALPGSGVFLATSGIVGNTLIYSQSASQGATFYSRTYTIPLSGGIAALLDDEQYNTHSRWSIGNRVIYHRHAQPPAQARNDLVSVLIDGTNRVVLTTDPANEAVQGVIGDQVIFRRNFDGGLIDHLVAVPVLGGPERVVMVMDAQEEFVDLIVDEVMIIRRQSGTWSLDVEGTLTQLGALVIYDPVVVGDAVCGMTRGTLSDALWCLPLDGQGPQVKIANDGVVVGVFIRSLE